MAKKQVSSATKDAMLEALKERLSSPRLKAPGTIYSYLCTASHFLDWVGNRPIDEHTFRRYFIYRREQKISERTLKKIFFHLKKLALANKLPWTFTSDDTPYPEEERKLPALKQAEVEQLIKAKAKLSSAERFYLAVATTWIVRREELSRIKKRDYDGEALIIHAAKHGRTGKHLIPDELKQVFADYRPKEHTPTALSIMFHRICDKAGLELGKGYGWHSIRYRLNTLLKDVCLPQNRLNPSLVSDYAHWKQSTGSRYMETDMTEYYRRPEILDTDPYGIDRVIYSIHPFLPLWDKKPHGK